MEGIYSWEDELETEDDGFTTFDEDEADEFLQLSVDELLNLEILK